MREKKKCREKGERKWTDDLIISDGVTEFNNLTLDRKFKEINECYDVVRKIYEKIE